MERRHKTIIAIGSNYEQDHNVDEASARLKLILSDVRCSKRLWTEPIGIVSDKFLNRVISGYTLLPLEQLTDTLKTIEQECGRSEKSQRHGVIPMDIDILEFDGNRLHEDDWSREYIKELSKEITSL